LRRSDREVVGRVARRRAPSRSCRTDAGAIMRRDLEYIAIGAETMSVTEARA